MEKRNDLILKNFLD